MEDSYSDEGGILRVFPGKYPRSDGNIFVLAVCIRDWCCCRSYYWDFEFVTRETAMRVFNEKWRVK